MPSPHRSREELLVELKRLQRRSAGDRDELALLHEIQVYQEEIVVQNEELLHAQHQLEETRDQFVELYDFAPNGYLTLDGHGVIRRINLTGASLLGRQRNAIEGLPLLGFLPREQRPAFLDFLRRCRRCRDGGQVEDELMIESGDDIRHVQLLCRPRISSSTRSREFFTAMVDFTERKRLEDQRDDVAREHAALASRVLTAQDDERQRIARDLHDDLGQEVTALRLKLDAAAARGAGDGALDGFRDMLEKLDSRLHFIATALRPASLDLGIVVALRQYVQKWSATLGITSDFHSSGLDHRRLRADVETQIYRVTQEALNNVHKHAGATRVGVVLEARGSGMVLIVEDNGRGFGTRRRREREGGLGLVGMRERAQIIGARLEVASSPKGTRVLLRLPDLAAVLD